MDLLLIRQTWGIEKPWDRVFAQFAEMGFKGVEVALPFLEPRAEHVQMMQEHGLSCVPMIFTKGKTVAEHVRSFREQLEAAIEFQPLLVTCHDGRDAFTEEESDAYFTAVMAVERDTGARVAHETHRGRILYNPWTTSRILDKFSDLRLCCDFSHWVCVCERLIDDQSDIIRQCAEHAIHIHARVGYGEGPQVPDPRAPEYSAELEAHERWWDIIWDAAEKRGLEQITLTPEFGPPPYMHTVPYSGRPVADLWEISNWMGARQKERFNTRNSMKRGGG